MKTIEKKQKPFAIPHYDENAALQLIVITSITYIAFHFTKVLFLVFGREKQEVLHLMYTNVGLQSIELFKQKVWTLLTYGLAHHGFWEWVSNAVWIYCFAAVLQQIAGYKQVLPLFFYGLLVGGIVYFSGLLLPGNTFALQEGQYIMGAYAGVAALAVGAVVLSPKARFSLSDSFSIPLLAMVVIYFVMTIAAYYETKRGVLLLSAGGALTGLLVALLLRNGYQPSLWIYDFFERMQKRFERIEDQSLIQREHRKRKEVLQSFYTPTDDITQEQIDELLDKINEKGYASLTRDEKDMLRRASS